MNKEQSNNEGNEYTRDVRRRIAQHEGTTEHCVIRELCALYDPFCTCPATTEARLYIRQRITNYLDKLADICDK